MFWACMDTNYANGEQLDHEGTDIPREFLYLVTAVQLDTCMSNFNGCKMQ